jgi:hypothetical protein
MGRVRGTGSGARVAQRKSRDSHAHSTRLWAAVLLVVARRACNDWHVAVAAVAIAGFNRRYTRARVHGGPTSQAHGCDEIERLID